MNRQINTSSNSYEHSTAIYTEAFGMLKFYGDKAILIRNIAYTQGFVILSSAGFLLNKDFSDVFKILASALSIFCLLFTIALWWSHNNYHHYYLDIRYLISNIENKIGLDDDISYIEVVEKRRDNRVDSNTLGKMKVHGSFIVIGIAAFAMFTLSLCVRFFH